MIGSLVCLRGANVNVRPDAPVGLVIGRVDEGDGNIRHDACWLVAFFSRSSRMYVSEVYAFALRTLGEP